MKISIRNTGNQNLLKLLLFFFSQGGFGYLYFQYLLYVLCKLGPSGGFRGGSRGSLEPPSGTKLFRFHGEFKEILSEIRLTNPPFLHLNPLLKNPGSAPGTRCNAKNSEYGNIKKYIFQNVCFNSVRYPDNSTTNHQVIHLNLPSTPNTS